MGIGAAGEGGLIYPYRTIIWLRVAYDNDFRSSCIYTLVKSFYSTCLGSYRLASSRLRFAFFSQIFDPVRPRLGSRVLNPFNIAIV